MMERPNIIVINRDGLGYGDLGCYGEMGACPHDMGDTVTKMKTFDR